MTNKFDT